MLICICIFTLIALPACSKSNASDDATIDIVDPVDVTTDHYLLFNEDTNSTCSVAARAEFDMPSRIVIPSKYNDKTVTSIASHGFKNRKTIREVVIPATVTKISASAFYGCASLEKVTIPSSVTTMEYLAFYGCHYLESITYQGTKNQWKSIVDNGAFFYSVTILCTDGEIKA